ncbi:alpha/beta fold hydrolase [Microbacterium immunditiarum]|uniref:Pimeloyl-ACP methyl ester carboxylesterase n=1 Tax=Microbacterium immunditiarum TaxID=337480 RepID=A0A7Y9GLZ9_9MICO|nr:pimeloyl-ACP methyl ester carboxylesterase [Microbacterium immunditiarum]
MTALLLHPIGLDRTTWDHVPIEDALAVDLPGHGNAPWDGMRGLGQVADIVLDMVPATAEPLDLVGVSLGGMVALHAALRHPGWVRSIVVACALAAAPTEVMLERATKTELVGMHGMTSSMISRWFTPDAIETRPRLIASTERRLLADDPTVIAHYWRLISTHDVRAQLRRISVPTTVIAGRADVSGPPAAARELSARMPQARFVELPGAHMLHLEEPRAFADAVPRHRLAA